MTVPGETVSKTKQVVGISELFVSRDPEEVIITYSLGSCLGVTIYDPVARVGGLLHCLLPLSGINPKEAQKKPAMFVDTGIPLLFKSAYQLGAQKKRIIIKVAGCGEPLGVEKFFQIGKRNYTVCKKLLWKNDVLIENESVGGGISRTLWLDLA
ncbi:chemotaxis protein CheD, partial [Thermodesulfobacteriota bacterium]